MIIWFKITTNFISLFQNSQINLSNRKLIFYISCLLLENVNKKILHIISKKDFVMKNSLFLILIFNLNWQYVIKIFSFYFHKLFNYKITIL